MAAQKITLYRGLASEILSRGRGKAKRGVYHSKLQWLCLHEITKKGTDFQLKKDLPSTSSCTHTNLRAFVQATSLLNCARRYCHDERPRCKTTLIIGSISYFAMYSCTSDNTQQWHEFCSRYIVFGPRNLQKINQRRRQRPLQLCFILRNDFCMILRIQKHIENLWKISPKLACPLGTSRRWPKMLPRYFQKPRREPTMPRKTSQDTVQICQKHQFKHPFSTPT